jgi:hypothetical protein
MTVSEKKQKDYALALHARVTRGVPEKKRQDYAFRHQFDEKPSITPGCPGRGVPALCFSVHMYALQMACCGGLVAQARPADPRQASWFCTAKP